LSGRLPGISISIPAAAAAEHPTAAAPIPTLIFLIVALSPIAPALTLASRVVSFCDQSTDIALLHGFIFSIFQKHKINS
jgi:hypothetical protein